MKGQRMPFIAASSLFCLFLSQALVAETMIMSDPVFGIHYDTAKIHFEKAPVALGRLCADVAHGQYWVYAYLKRDNIEYFIVGTRESHSGGSAVVVFDNKGCAVGLSDWLITGNPAHGGPYKVADSVVRGLISDLFRRYSTAFGGKMQFLERVRKNPPDERMTILKSELDKFSKSIFPYQETRTEVNRVR